MNAVWALLLLCPLLSLTSGESSCTFRPHSSHVLYLPSSPRALSKLRQLESSVVRGERSVSISILASSCKA